MREDEAWTELIVEILSSVMGFLLYFDGMAIRISGVFYAWMKKPFLHYGLMSQASVITAFAFQPQSRFYTWIAFPSFVQVNTEHTFQAQLSFGVSPA